MLTIIATVGVIFVNYLAATGKINNTTPGDISDKYATAITPAGYAFSIWSLIYLGLIAFSVYQALPSQTESPLFKKIRLLYIAGCAANCLWIYLWHYDFIPASLLAMTFILLSLVMINLRLAGNLSKAEIWTTKLPFNLYFGWITMASLLNAVIVTVYYKIKFPDTANIFLACFLLAIGAVAAVFVCRKYDFPVYAIAIAWALFAIAVNQSDKSIIMITAIITGLIALASAFVFKKRIVA